MSFSGESYSLKPIERTTIADQVRRQLLELIREGKFSPGQKMPSERQLCEDFGVARNSSFSLHQGKERKASICRCGKFITPIIVVLLQKISRDLNP